MSRRKPSARQSGRFATAALILALQAAVAFAGPSARFDIPAQPLSSALRALASQAGVQLVFTPETVGAAKSAAVKGEMDVEAALRQLLAGSGLEFRQEGERNYVVVSIPRPANESVLSEMVVTATRTERPADEVPASVSVLNEKDLATKSRQNIANALRDVEGLDFVAQQSVGHQMTPTIRGFNDPKYTQVLVGGMAQDSIVSQVLGRGGLNFVPLHDVERIEIVRGPASALYGPNTVAGVINVLSKRWAGGPGAEVDASYGSHNTRTLGAAVGTASDTFDIRLSALDAQSDGYKSVPTADLDGQYDLAPRDWKDNKLGLMAGFRPADGHELTLELRQFATRSAGYGGRPNDRSDIDGDLATIGYRYDWSKDTNIKIDFTNTKLKQRYTFDRWYWNGTLITPGTVSAADLALFRYGGRDSASTFFQALLQTRPFAGNELILGYSRDTGDFEQYSVVASTGVRSVTGSKSQIDGLFVQDEQRFGALVLTAGIRQDRIELSPDTVNGVPKNGSGSVANIVNPRVGARYHVTEATSFYASYGTAYTPALNVYRFVQPSATRVDNPDLKPESSKTYEIGMNNRLAVGTFRTALFHTDYQDKITLGTDAATGKQQYQNMASVKVSGLEFAYQGDLGGGWKPYANFSYTKARDYARESAPGTQSLRIAPRKFNAGVTYAPGDAWAATLNARYVSGLYFANLTDAQRADGYTQVDFKISARIPALGQKWEGFVAVNNLTDKKYETFSKGEWSDGRTVTVGLSGSF